MTKTLRSAPADQHDTAHARLLGDRSVDSPCPPRPPTALTLCHFALSSSGDTCDGCRHPIGPYHVVTGRSDGHLFCSDGCEHTHPNVNTPTENAP